MRPKNPLTILPFMLALVIGLAGMGTSVYDIHARQVGALDVGHGHTRAVSDLVTEQPTVMTRFLERLTFMATAEDGFIAADLLVPAVGAKALKQRAADIVSCIDKTEAELMDASATPEAKEKARADLAQLSAMATANKADQEVAANLAAFRGTVAAVPDPDQAAATRAAANAGVTVTDRSEQDPKRGFKDHRDYLNAVMVAGRNPNRIDARLKPLAAAGSDEQGEYSDPHGGFLVPHGVAPGILSVEPEDDVLGTLVTPVTMTAPTVSFNARVDKNHATSVSGGFIVTRRPETVDGTSSRQKYEQIALTANEEFGLAFASERIINDSPESFVAIVQAGFRDEYAANAMNERINGTGVGERQGALNAGCKISVSKEAGQKAGTILKENIDAMAARCWRYRRAIWLANHNTRAALKSLVQVVGTGGNSVPYFVTDGAPAGFDGMLDGRPLVFTEFAKTLGTEGDMILMVPSEYLEGTYQSEQYAESIHVRFAAAERAFRFYRRNDGQWWWSSPLTPKNGSTLSPVVTLATRG